jgi:hypothetical protein
MSQKSELGLPTGNHPKALITIEHKLSTKNPYLKRKIFRLKFILRFFSVRRVNEPSKNTENASIESLRTDKPRGGQPILAIRQFPRGFLFKCVAC